MSDKVVDIKTGQEPLTNTSRRNFLPLQEQTPFGPPMVMQQQLHHVGIQINPPKRDSIVEPKAAGNHYR